MPNPITTIASGFNAAMTKTAITSNNIANIQTTAFKADYANIVDLPSQALRDPGNRTLGDNNLPSGLQVGQGVTVQSTLKDFKPGEFVLTNQELDLYISGQGFFPISVDRGEAGIITAYTRDGSFRKDKEGRLVTSQGYPLEGDITIPDEAASIRISADGVVTAIFAHRAEQEELGQINLAHFRNQQGLRAVGDNLYESTEASGDPELVTPGASGTGQIQQHGLEGSNVNIQEAMMALMQSNQVISMLVRCAETSNEMLTKIANMD